jgi:hypothetical protein
MSLSFIHHGDADMASYRYRAANPAALLGASLNDSSADVLIFAKPAGHELSMLREANRAGCITIVDFCDVHWHMPQISSMLNQATAVTANTEFMAQLIHDDTGRTATVIPDAYEYEECLPHCKGNRLLWFGHSTNGASLNRLMGFSTEYPLRVVTNKSAQAPDSPIDIVDWSTEALRQEFAKADIVLLPDTAPHKSANRAIEAIRQGCFVVAEPHPALTDFPGIWIGNLRKGVVWASQHQEDARSMTEAAQQYVKEKYSLEHTVSALRTLLTELSSTWEQDVSTGTAGSISIPSVARVV